MKIGVCLKQVPATDSPIKVKDAASGVDLAAVKMVINPYDEFALEEALKLKDAGVATQVIVYTVGPADADARLKDAVARGADTLVRIEDASLAGADSLGLARALAAAAKADGCGLVLCGKQAVDSDNAQVPAMIAELLGWAQATECDKLEVSAGGFKAWVAAGGGARDVLQGSLPAVISTDKGINSPRSPNIKGVMASKKAPVAVKDLAALGLSAGDVAAKVALKGWGAPPPRPAGRMLQGSAAQVAKELVTLLRTEAKVI